MAEPFPFAIPNHEPDTFIEDEARFVDRLMEQQLVDIYYQPIVDLRSRSLFAYEALCRPKDEYFRTPGELIEAAVRSDRMGKLGRHLRSISISGCSRWPLFLNLDPHEFGAPYLVRPDDPVFTYEWPVYLEISEDVPTEFFEQCNGILAELRKKGVLLAIDDFGAGASSLKYIVELKPDIVKLDRELVMGCLPDSREFIFLKSLTELCHRMNAKVIAEGIETVQEFKATMAAGIDYGQGFLLAPPHNPPPSFIWPPEVPPDSCAYLREYGSVERPDHPGLQLSRPPSAADGATSQPEPNGDTADLHATIQSLESQLAEVREELEESVEQRATLAQKLKRVSHSSNTKHERQPSSTIPGQVPVGSPATSVDHGDSRGSNEEDALEFLRQLEAQEADGADGSE